MAGIHMTRRTLAHGAELFREVFNPEPNPAYSVEVNELEDYEANLSGGESDFDSDVDIYA